MCPSSRSVGPLDHTEVGLGMRCVHDPEQRLEGGVGLMPLGGQPGEPRPHADWRRRAGGRENVLCQGPPRGVLFSSLGARSRSNAQQSAQVQSAEPLPAGQEAELHQHADGHDMRTGAGDEPGGGLDGAPGCQHVVDDEDPVADSERVLVDLDRGLSVLEP